MLLAVAVVAGVAASVADGVVADGVAAVAALATVGDDVADATALAVVAGDVEAVAVTPPAQAASNEAVATPAVMPIKKPRRDS